MAFPLSSHDSEVNLSKLKYFITSESYAIILSTRRQACVWQLQIYTLDLNHAIRCYICSSIHLHESYHCSTIPIIGKSSHYSFQREGIQAAE
jgi:hypothetical protein